MRMLRRCLNGHALCAPLFPIPIHNSSCTFSFRFQMSTTHCTVPKKRIAFAHDTDANIPFVHCKVCRDNTRVIFKIVNDLGIDFF